MINLLVKLELGAKGKMFSTTNHQTPNFTDFMAPGIIILIMYFLAMVLTGEVFILERKDGLIDRHVVLFIRPYRLLYLCGLV